MSIVTLTSTFAASPSCLAANNIWALSVNDGAGDHLQLQLGPPVAQAPACYPEAYQPATSVIYPFSACPSGYTTACTATIGTADGIQTTQVCCPSVFDFVCGQEQLDAAEQYRQSPLLSNLGCWLSVPTARTFTGVQTFASESVTTTDVVQGSGILAAYAVQIQTTQLATMPATTAGLGASSTSSVSAMSTYLRPHGVPSEGPTIDIPPPSSSGGISNGVAVGIGLSCGFALVLACMLVWILRSAARKRRGELMARSFDYATDRVSRGSKQSRTSTLPTAGGAEATMT